MIIDQFRFLDTACCEDARLSAGLDEGIPQSAIQNMPIGRDTSQLGDETLASIPLRNLPIPRLIDLTGEERVSSPTVRILHHEILFLSWPSNGQRRFWVGTGVFQCSLHSGLPMDQTR